jgi:hypothetical protein
MSAPEIPQPQPTPENPNSESLNQAIASVLEQLSGEQLAALNEEQKATFCLLHPADQKFFARAFPPKDLPVALNRKKSLILANQKEVDQWEALRTRLARPLVAPEEANKVGLGELGLVLAGVAGVGAAVAIASDGTAQWEGIQPADIVPALNTEFADKERTDFEVTGNPDALEGTVFLISSRQFVPALTINLTRVQNGTQVKVSDMTSAGLLETVKKGGQTLLRLAQKGFSLWTRSRRGLGGGAEVFDTAGSLFEDGSSIAGLAHDLRLERRAWETIKRTADSLERARQERLRQEREARYALEQAWDRYYHCPRCSVPFGEGDKECQVCGTERPPMPAQPDPRS